MHARCHHNKISNLLHFCYHLEQSLKKSLQALRCCIVKPKEVNYPNHSNNFWHVPHVVYVILRLNQVKTD